MKKLLIIASILYGSSNYLHSQVGIGTNSPNGALEINSSTQGFIPPKVSLTSTLLELPVTNPQGGTLTTGTIVWNTATAGTSPNNVSPGLYYWDGTKWIAFAGPTGGLDWSLTGNSGTTPGTHFLGTTDNQNLYFYTNNTERMRISNTGNAAINSTGATTTQLDVIAAGTNDGVASRNNDNIANAFWGRNSHTSGVSILGATNGLGGVFPNKGTGVAGAGINSHGIYGNTGNGAPNNTAHNGNSAAVFNLDTDNDPNTNNGSAYASLAGKDETVVAPLGAPARRILYGGYFVGGTTSGGQSYSYVGLKYNHNNDATATGGTNYKIVGNGTVSTLIPDESYSPRVMFCPEAPEVLFEDYGTAKLIDGRCYVELDKIVAKSLKIDENHPLKVFIQLEGDCKGVYVTEKSNKGFLVKELQDGKSNTPFSWHIVGNRANDIDKDGNIISYYEDLRLPYGPTPINKSTAKEKKL